MHSQRRVIVCYIPGLDTRRITADLTPEIAAMIDRYSSIEMSTLPSTDLVPTFMTGVYPHQHHSWQVSLNEHRDRTPIQRLIDVLPDLATTTVQCVRQKFNPEYDLATMPPRRRRELTQHRSKYIRRVKSHESLDKIEGYDSLLGLLEPDSHYGFIRSFDDLESLAQKLPAEAARLEILQMHALDHFQHWHLDNDAKMREALAMTDRFVGQLREGCARSGHTFVLLSDHGQELVTNTIPLVQTLQKSGVPQEEYSYFCELATARLWFHTDRARDTITARIRELSDCQLLHFSEMHQYHVCFEDDRFGEYYVLADAGSIYFPHDFYHPIAGLYLGLTGPLVRPRMFNPVHRGNHGYRPEYPSEKGFLMVADDDVKPAQETMTLIDFAPTMLAYLGAEIPSHMTGNNVLTACQNPE
ncbi:MAG: alkaline phosphatase family protein [Gemmatimonadota bacterium]